MPPVNGPRVDGPERVGRPLEGDDILILADDVWRAPKRARHKVPEAWARAGNRVLWIETPYPSERAKGDPSDVTAASPGLFVATPTRTVRTHTARRRPWEALREPVGRLAYIASVRRAMTRVGLEPDWTVIWQEPRLVFALSSLPTGRRIYYASDRFEDRSGRGREAALLRACLDRVHLVFATSEKIADALRPLHPEVHVIPHAVDPSWWSEADRVEPADLARIPHPRLLFVGVGTVKFDLELWLTVARSQPSWQLVTVGPFHDALRDTEPYRQLEALPNVHLLGERPHADLPGYIAHADVLTCPYRDDAIRAASGLPNKFYEYALSNLPILSTPFTTFEATLPQLSVVPGRDWPGVDLDALPGGEGLPAGVTYADRVETQRSILARVSVAPTGSLETPPTSL